MTPRMTPEQFLSWLQGMLDSAPDNGALNAAQTDLVRERLSEVIGRLAAERMAGESWEGQAAMLAQMRLREAEWKAQMARLTIQPVSPTFTEIKQ